MTDIVERLRKTRSNDGFAVLLKQHVDEAAKEIERLQAKIERWQAQSIAQYAEIQRLRTTLGYLADNIDNPALVAVAETALKPKP